MNESNQVSRLRTALGTARSVAYIYGIDRLFHEATKYIDELDDAFYVRHELLQSAIKLSSRFMCDAASILCFYLCRDIREHRLQKDLKDCKSYIVNRSQVHQLRLLAKWL